MANNFNTLDDRLRFAVSLAKVGNTAQAREIVTAILREAPDHADAWLVMAQLVEDRREVIHCLKQVVRLDPTNARAAAYLQRIDPSAKASRSAPPQAAQPRQSAPRRSAMPLLLGLILISCTAGLVVLALSQFGGFGFSTGLFGLQSGELPPTVQPIPPSGALTPTASVTAMLPTDTPTPTSTQTPQPTATIMPSDTPIPTSTPQATSLVGTQTLNNPTAVISALTVSYSTIYYTFDGNSVDDIRRAIETKGPSVTQGSHAIASTQYSFHVEWQELQQGDTCTLRNPSIDLGIIYTYPRWQPSIAPSGELQGQWDAFIAHVVDHEEHHAELAIECAGELLEAMKSMTAANTCTSLNTTINQTYDSHVETCTAIQEAFDEAEGTTTFPLPGS